MKSLKNSYLLELLSINLNVGASFANNSEQLLSGMCQLDVIMPSKMPFP